MIIDFTNYLIDFWNLMRNNFIEIDDYINDNEGNAAEDMRSPSTGGNIFFRPIGLLPFVESVSKIKLSDSNLSYGDILQRFSRMNRIVSQEPWNMILWNPLTNRMIMRNQSLVKYLLINMFDTSFLSQRENQEMKSKFATIFNISEQEAVRRINSCNI